MKQIDNNKTMKITSSPKIHSGMKTVVAFEDKKF